jgi:hypothetical protein
MDMTLFHIGNIKHMGDDNIAGVAKNKIRNKCRRTLWRGQANAIDNFLTRKKMGRSNIAAQDFSQANACSSECLRPLSPSYSAERVQATKRNDTVELQQNLIEQMVPLFGKCSTGWVTTFRRRQG